jgi:hypothetical protein
VRTGGKRFLEVHLGAQQGGIVGRQEGQHGGGGLVAPVEAAQIGLVEGEVDGGQVHLGDHGADGGAVHWPRRHLRAAFELADDGGRLAVQGDDQFSLVVGHGGRHEHAVLGQVSHQVQVKRQLLEREVFENRQDEFAALRGEEKVAVLNARGDAADGQRFA